MIQPSKPGEARGRNHKYPHDMPSLGPRGRGARAKIRELPQDVRFSTPYCSFAKHVGALAVHSPESPPLTRAGRPARSGGHEAAARPQAGGTLQEDLLEDLQLRGWRSRRSLRRHFAAVSNSFSFSKVLDYCKQT